MKVIRLPKKLRQAIDKHKAAGQFIGFVPTMGYLHEGHLSLVRQAAAQNDVVVVSIFVNPIQFGPREDFARYPRDEKRDCAMLRKAGVDIVFIPEVTDMYPGYPQVAMTRVSTPGLQDCLCGKSRPGHFDGVTTVVAKLFNMVAPDRAYFGLKDYQQYLIISKMTADLDFPVRVIGCPIVREQDGLAMSSRNSYLTPAEREQVPAINKQLRLVAKAVKQGVSFDCIRLDFVAAINQSITGSRIDYFEILSADTLQPVSATKPGTKLLLACAVFVGKTRLIDNVVV